jgi:peroxiredoxin
VLEAGDKAPSFTLPDQNGEKVRLAELKGETVVLYFYPRADTPAASHLDALGPTVGRERCVSCVCVPPAYSLRLVPTSSGHHAC